MPLPGVRRRRLCPYNCFFLHFIILLQNEWTTWNQVGYIPQLNLMPMSNVPQFNI